jgi:hypothetical protein
MINKIIFIIAVFLFFTNCFFKANNLIEVAKDKKLNVVRKYSFNFRDYPISELYEIKTDPTFNNILVTYSTAYLGLRKALEKFNAEKKNFSNSNESHLEIYLAPIDKEKVNEEPNEQAYFGLRFFLFSFTMGIIPYYLKTKLSKKGSSIWAFPASAGRAATGYAYASVRLKT